MAHAVTISVPCSGSSGGGPGGLAAAINTANSTLGPNTINLTPGCVYTLTSPYDQADSPNGLPPITSTLIINGYGATVARSQAASTRWFRIFAVLTGGNLTLNTVIVRGGNSFAQNCEVWDFYSIGHGGGLCVASGGNLTLNHSTVTENTAGGNEGLDEGGGIYNEGTATLNYSVVTKNDASNFSEFGGRGGGIYNRGSLTLQGSIVTHNTAQGTSGDVGLSNGGGIYSGERFFTGASLVIHHSVLSYNTASSRAAFGSSATGGGIVVVQGSTATLDHSAILNNIVIATGGTGATVAAGAGIDVQAQCVNVFDCTYGTATLDHVVLFGNSATASLSPGASSDATATAHGGALAILGKATLLHTFVHCNIARAPDGVARGGGIDNGGTAILEHSKVVNNTAEGNTLANSLGGGIYNANPANGSVALTLTHVKDNHPDQCDPTGSVPGCSN